MQSIPRYIYKSVVFQMTTGLMGYNMEQTNTNLEQTVNIYAEEGWQLLQIVPPIYGTTSFFLVFQRLAVTPTEIDR